MNPVDLCEDSLLKDVCLPVFSLVAVTSLSALTIFKLWSFKYWTTGGSAIQSDHHASSSSSGNAVKTSVASLEARKASLSIEAKDDKRRADFVDGEDVYQRVAVPQEVAAQEGEERVNEEKARPPLDSKTFQKDVVQAVYRRAFQELLVNPTNTPLAALVNVRNGSESIDIICMTTGVSAAAVASKWTSSGIGGSLHSIRSLPRISLADCRAEVIVRRAFVAFIYNELYKTVNNNDESDFLERRPDDQGFRVKSDCNLILVQSALEMESWIPGTTEAIRGGSTSSGGLNCSTLTTVSTAASSSRHKSFDIAGNLATNLARTTTKTTAIFHGRTSSSSSARHSLEKKFSVWSCLGLQGAILSHLVDPIHLKGIIIPSYRKSKVLEGSLREALTQAKLALAPEGLELVLPAVHGLRMSRKTPLFVDVMNPPQRDSRTSSSSQGSETQQQPRWPGATRQSCVNWIKGFPSCETIFEDTGATAHGKGSRLCKAVLFDLFAGLSFGRSFPTLPWSAFRPAYPLNYGRVKAQAVPYQRSKELVRKHLWGTTEYCENGQKSSCSLRNNFNAFDPK